MFVPALLASLYISLFLAFRFLETPVPVPLGGFWDMCTPECLREGVGLGQPHSN